MGAPGLSFVQAFTEVVSYCLSNPVINRLNYRNGLRNDIEIFDKPSSFVSRLQWVSFDEE